MPANFLTLPAHSISTDMENMTELLQSIWLSLEGYEPCAYTRDALRDEDLKDEIKNLVQVYTDKRY